MRVGLMRVGLCGRVAVSLMRVGLCGYVAVSLMCVRLCGYVAVSLMRTCRALWLQSCQSDALWLRSFMWSFQSNMQHFVGYMYMYML